MGDHRRFTTLDGLRGFAALMVLSYHLGSGAPIVAPSGYLAVDLFFGLSGFVIALAYEDRIRQGLSLTDFTLLRLIRMYPMALLGALIAFLLSGRHPTSMLLLPDFGSGGALYPINVPLWSLASELVVNVAFAACALRVGWRWLIAILVGSAATLTVGAMAHGTADLGAAWQHDAYGLARTVFSFSLGVAMHRLHVKLEVTRGETWLAWLLPAALIPIFAFLPPHTVAWDLIAIFMFLPAILWLGTIWEAPRTRLFEALGGLSYPLYCIHGPIVFALHMSSVPPQATFVALLAAGWWLNSRVDQPVRQWLMRQFSLLRSKRVLA